jgi:hypothetical protein
MSTRLDLPKIFLRVGIALFVSGAALAFLVLFTVYESLYNYQRIAVVIPMFAAIPFLQSYTFANWNAASDGQRLSALGSFVLPLFFIITALSWYVNAPFARA